MRQRRVVERADLLRDPHRLRAHLDDQRLADAPGRLVAGGGRDPDAAAASRATSSVRPVNVMTGCSASGSTPCSAAGASTADPVRAGGVHHDLAGPEAARGGQAADQAGEHVVRHGEQRQVGAGHDLVRRPQRDVRAAARRRGWTDARETPEVATTRCPAAAQRRPHDGADPPGRHDADGEPRGPASTHRFTPRSFRSRARHRTIAADSTGARAQARRGADGCTGPLSGPPGVVRAPGCTARGGWSPRRRAGLSGAADRFMPRRCMGGRGTVR